MIVVSWNRNDCWWCFKAKFLSFLRAFFIIVTGRSVCIVLVWGVRNYPKFSSVNSKLKGIKHLAGSYLIKSYNLFYVLYWHRLTPCDGLCLGFEKYSLSKASSGDIPDFLCFFFLGWGWRPFEAPGFNFTRWVLLSTSLAKRRDSVEDNSIKSCIEPKRILF